MQEIKHLILRVGTTANVEEYVFDGPMADAHVQGYLNQGYTVHTVHPGSVDQSTNSMSVFYVLIRDVEPQLEIDLSKKSQEAINQMVTDASKPSQDSAWIPSVDKEAEAFA